MGVYTLENDCRAERWELHWCDAVLQAGPDIMYALPHPPGCIARPNAQCCWIELFEHVPIIPLCKHCSTRTRLPASMPVGVGRKAALMQGGLMHQTSPLAAFMLAVQHAAQPLHCTGTGAAVKSLQGSL